MREAVRPALLGRVTDTPSSCCARSRSLGGSSRCQTANTSRNSAAVLRSGNKCFAIIGTAHVVIGAGSMRRYGVRPSVRQSLPARAHSSKPAAVGLLLWARPAGDIDRLLRQGGVQQVNAGSATLSAYVGSWTQTCYILIRREQAVHKNWCK